MTAVVVGAPMLATSSSRRRRSGSESCVTAPGQEPVVSALERTFDEPVEVTFRCTLHPGMTGRVAVTVAFQMARHRLSGAAQPRVVAGWATGDPGQMTGSIAATVASAVRVAASHEVTCG
jgi:hypothetical protein